MDISSAAIFLRKQLSEMELRGHLRDSDAVRMITQLREIEDILKTAKTRMLQGLNH